MAGWVTFAAKVLDSVLGYQDVNELKDREDALAQVRFQHHLGGSRSQGVLSASYVAVPDWIDVELDGTYLAGLTCRVRVELRTADAATSVTFRLYNVTAGAAMTLSPVAASCTATNTNYSGTNQVQSCTFTPTTGVNKYRLQIVGGNATNEIYAIGFVEIFGAVS